MVAQCTSLVFSKKKYKSYKINCQSSVTEGIIIHSTWENVINRATTKQKKRKLFQLFELKFNLYVMVVL